MTIENPLLEIEKGIEKAESVCDAEIVVTFSEMSGPYRDIRILWGSIGALITLGILMFSPIEFNPMYLIPNVIISFLLFYWISSKFTSFLKLLTSKTRRINQVRANSELIWFRQGVSLTRRRTGILVYVSLLERQGELICDTGITKLVPKSVIGELEIALRKVAEMDEPVSGFGTFLDKLAGAVAKYVPEAEDNPDELPNTPVWIRGDDLWN
jgi:putative membrane protein